MLELCRERVVHLRHHFTFRRTSLESDMRRVVRACCHVSSSSDPVMQPERGLQPDGQREGLFFQKLHCFRRWFQLFLCALHVSELFAKNLCRTSHDFRQVVGHLSSQHWCTLFPRLRRGGARWRCRWWSADWCRIWICSFVSVHNGRKHCLQNDTKLIHCVSR